MKIFILVLTILFNLSLFAQSGTVVFTSTDGDNIGQVLVDGTYSNDIPGIQLVGFGSLSEADAVNRTYTGSFAFFEAASVSMSDDIVVPIDQTSGNTVSDYDNLPKVIVLMSNDGSEFSFESIFIGNYINAQDSTRFEAYRDGTLIGEVVLNISSGFDETFSGTDFPSATFGNVDEVRISNGDGDISNPFYAGFNNIGINSALPVELSSFTAKKLDDSIKLNWQTASEVNNYGFYVEKRYITSNDTTGWTEIGFVEGKGTFNSGYSYSYTDNDLSHTADKVSYRLKQTDNDGTFEYSKTVTVNLSITTDVKDESVPAEFSLAQNYPNPFNPETTIKYQVAAPGNVSIKVYDLLGKEVETLVNKNMAPGKYQIKFNGSNLPSGIYFYKMQSGNFVSVKKLMLMK